MPTSLRAALAALPPALLAGLLASACGAPPLSSAPPQPPPWTGPDRLAPAAPTGGDAGEPRDLLDLLALADERNPRIGAAHAQWEAALERAPQVGTLPDPHLTLRWYAAQVETRVGPQQWAIGLSQTFPLGGKLGLREELAGERAAAAWYRLQDERLGVFREVEDAWLEGTYLDRATAVVRRSLDLAVDLERVARNRYASGATGFHEVLRAQVEIGQIDDRLRSLEDLRRPVLARINATLNRPPGAPIPWATEIPASADLADDLDPLGRLPSRNPELLALGREVEAAARALELAAASDVPDLRLGLERISTGGAPGPAVPGSGTDPLLLTIGADLPVQRARHHAIEAQARAELRAARMYERAALDRLTSEVERDHYTYRDASRRVDLYERTLVPRAQQALEATDIAYRSGGADYLDLVDAQEVLLEFELSLERARTDRAQSRAHLLRLLVDLPPAPDDPRDLPENTEEPR